MKNSTDGRNGLRPDGLPPPDGFPRPGRLRVDPFPSSHRSRPLRGLVRRFLRCREPCALTAEALADVVENLTRRPLSRLLPRIRAERPSGAWGEARAGRYLRRRGLRILERNYKVHSGEIDIVALEERTIVFVEVKTVHCRTRVAGFDRLDPTKRRRLERAACSYLRRCRLDFDRWRWDAVVVEFERTRRGRRKLLSMKWYPAAFDV